MSVKKGQRYRAETDVRVTCMTSWASPYTGGYDRVLPQGETIVVSDDPPEGATAVYADPVNYDELHKQMVPAWDRLRFWSYRGYYLCVDLKRLAVEFSLLTG